MKLREEVQRLAGEVEVLRGVVEEGLKERRASREIQVQHSVADTAMSLDLAEQEEQDEGNGDEEVAEEDDSEMSSDEEEEQDEAEPFDPVSIQEASSRVNQADKTMRTDFATVGSTNLADSTTSRRSVNKEELDHITAEVQERRSNHSSSSIGSQSRRVLSPSVKLDRHTTVEDEEAHERPPQLSNIPRHSQSRLQTTLQPESTSFRPTAPVAGYTPKQAGPTRFQEHPQDEPETPFPQIRGEYLERLFFSAPEHNAKTCTVCYRRRYRTGNSPWSYERKTDHARNAAEEQEDEGFSEGSEEGADMDRPARDNKGKQRDHILFPGHWRQAGRKEGLPPQTVVARVIRELEDDFTHYKRYVCWVIK